MGRRKKSEQIPHGKVYEDWLSKAPTKGTRWNWGSKWDKFTEWLTTTGNPLTGELYIEPSERPRIDELIYEERDQLSYDKFVEKWEGILRKYRAWLLEKFKPNSVRSYISTTKAFFNLQCRRPIKVKVPKPQEPLDEHSFLLSELQNMFRKADAEGQAKLASALSLGWQVDDFRHLEKAKVKKAIENVDEHGFGTIEGYRGKTKFNAVKYHSKLTPEAIEALRNWLRIHPRPESPYVWAGSNGNPKSSDHFNYWLKQLAFESGVTDDSKDPHITFKLFRKFTFDILDEHLGAHEAKRCVGKRIPITDSTYLKRLDKRIDRNFPTFAYPHLKLVGLMNNNHSKLEAVTKELEESNKALRIIARYVAIEMIKNKEIYAEMQKIGDNYGIIMPIENDIQALIDFIKPKEKPKEEN